MISFVYIRKRRGPKFAPCGTPEKSVDSLPSKYVSLLFGHIGSYEPIL